MASPFSQSLETVGLNEDLASGRACILLLELLHDKELLLAVVVAAAARQLEAAATISKFAASRLSLCGPAK